MYAYGLTKSSELKLPSTVSPWLSNLLLSNMDNGLVKSLVTNTAKNKLEDQLFQYDFFNKFRHKDRWYGKLALKTGLGLNDKQEQLYKTYKGLVDSINTKEWGKDPEYAKMVFNTQWKYDPRLRNQMNSAANTFLQQSQGQRAII